MVVLGDDLNNVPHPEANACLLTGNEVVFGWVILKLGTNVDLDGGGGQSDITVCAVAIINIYRKQHAACVNINRL